MAIQTENMVDVRIEGVKVDEFGISDTLDNYSDSDIINYLYVAGNSRMLGGNIDFYANNAGSYDTWQDGMPFNTGTVNNTIMTMKSGDGTYECTATGRYLGVILLHSTNDIYNDYITVTNSNGYVVITEFNAKKYLLEIGATLTQKANVGATSFTDTTNTLYNPHLDTLALKYKYGNDYVDTRYAVCPYHVLQYGGYLFLINAFNENETAQFRCSFNSSPLWNAGTVYYPFSFNDISKSISVAFNGYGFGTNWSNITEQDFVWTYSGPAQTYSNSDYVHLFTDYGARQFRCYYYYKNYNDCMMMYANGGMYFRLNGGTIYKPLIDNNVVYGFTDNLDAESDIDNYTGSNNHTIPVTPPTPPTPPVDAKDNEIDVDMSQFAPSVGFVNYIEMDYETAQHVASAFNTYNQSIWNIGGDLFKNLISYKIFAVYGTHSGTIKNIHIAGHELEYNDAPINGNYIDDLGVVDLGSVDVGSTFRFNDWRDFAPYTKIECFVPCCGWCQLPPWVMGRTVTGTMYIDIANGSCKAVIKAGKTPVAEIGGCVAVDVPFSSVATGAKAAGLITAITNGAVSAFNPTPQNLLSGSFGILSALNANYTETKGVMGDGSNINGCTQFLIKVTRPASTDTSTGEITNKYKHEKGIPCAKTKTLASGQGFTQIMDANIDGAMTDREKQMIIDGFRHGLIL